MQKTWFSLRGSMIFARLSRHLGFSKFVTPVELSQQSRSPISMVLMFMFCFECAFLMTLLGGSIQFLKY
jgi:hypothetical protein